MTEPIASRFQDRTVLVTGSNYGIGRATAERFAAEGGNVVVTGRDQDRCCETVAAIEAEGGEATAVPADLSEPAAVQALVENAADTYGEIDVLVISFLASTDAAFVTGASVLADGGRGAIMYDHWLSANGDRE